MKLSSMLFLFAVSVAAQSISDEPNSSDCDGQFSPHTLHFISNKTQGPNTVNKISTMQLQQHFPTMHLGRQLVEIATLTNTMTTKAFHLSALLLTSSFRS
jgi:hypothetical protein